MAQLLMGWDCVQCISCTGHVSIWTDYFLGTFLCCHHINSVVVRNCLVIALPGYLFNTCALSVQMV